MKEVAKKEYHDFLADKNVEHFLQGDKSPFTGIWKTKTGKIIAKRIPIGKHIGVSTDKYSYHILP